MTCRPGGCLRHAPRERRNCAGLDREADMWSPTFTTRLAEVPTLAVY